MRIDVEVKDLTTQESISRDAQRSGRSCVPYRVAAKPAGRALTRLRRFLIPGRRRQPGRRAALTGGVCGPTSK